jgi:hypothetical protein
LLSYWKQYLAILPFLMISLIIFLGKTLSTL